MVPLSAHNIGLVSFSDMIKRVFIALVLLASGLSSLYAVRIMPLGDSNTFGWDGSVSYRYYLWKQLQQAGYTNVDFVGTLTSTFQTGDVWDHDNDGHAA